MQFSVEQQAAITAKNRELLVSAAAGSGKTAVLIEKIYTMLLDEGLRVDRMLVVTFTRAAAAEMRERLKQRMAGDPSPVLRRERERLELANISTLHSFCHKLVQEFFQAVDIDPLSAVADATIASNLFGEAMDEAMEALYARAAEGDASAAALTAKFEDKQIVKMADELYTFLMTLADPFAWLLSRAEKVYTLEDLQSGAMADTLLSDCRVLLDGARELADELSSLADHPACHEKYLPSIKADREAVAVLLDAVSGGLSATVAAARRFALERMPGVRGLSDEEKEINLRYKELREGLKKLAGKVGALFAQEPETIVARLNAMQPALRGLYGLCETLHAAYMERKKRRSVLDPNDLEHMALEALRRPEIRAAVSARFDAVFVDEYQDISGVQEALLNAVKQENVNLNVSRETGRSELCHYTDGPETANNSVFNATSAFSIEQDGHPVNVSRETPFELQSRSQPVQSARDAWKQEGIDGERAASGIFSKAESEPSMGGLTEQENDSEACDNQTEWSKGVERTGAYVIPPNLSQPTKQVGLNESAGQRFFYVGDVKQSIYRFRQADPTLFMEKEKIFSDGEAAPQRRIDLNRNYRSRGAVIGGVNRVFEQIMRADVTEIAYDGRARLYAGLDTESDPPVSLHVFTTPLSAAERTRVQAAAIAREIKARLGQPFFDRKENRMRTLRKRDIAILSPRMKGVDEVLTRVLGSLGVPAYAEGGGAGLQSDEIAQVLCHLRLMDNIRDDVSLLTCLRSPAVGMTDAELAYVRIRTPGGSYLDAVRRAADGEDALAERCAGALRSLSHERFLMRNMPLPEYLWDWLSRSGLYAFYGCQPYGGLRQANLRLLCEKAAEHQARGGGLQAFLQSVVSVTAARESVSPTVIGPKEDVVRVMSIHKSKGLEFPVVYLMGLEAGFESAGGSALRLHQKLGVALPYVDEVRRVKGDTLLSSAVDLRKKTENLAERARVLYVGMTRARDECILMGCMETPRFSHTRPSAYSVYGAGNMLDWLVSCVDPAIDSLTVADSRISQQSTSFPHKTGVFSVVSHNSADETADLLRLAELRSDRESLAKQRSRLETLTGEARALAAELPPALAADPLAPDIRRDHRPFKVGVTSLVRAGQGKKAEPPVLVDSEADDPGDLETSRVKRLPLPLTRPRLIADLPQLPAFMRPAATSLRGLLRGVAAHKALCLLQYPPLRAQDGAPALRAEIRRQLRDFSDKRLFTQEEHALIDPESLALFFESEWGRDALFAETVRREWGFVLSLPEEDGMLVQGVIDLCYVKDGKWILLDYKTDAVSDAEALWPLYERQTALYARALSEVTGVDVRSVTLYSLSLNAGTTRNV